MDADGVPHPRPAFLQGAPGEKPSAHRGLTASFQEGPAVFLSTITPHAHGPNEGLGHLQQPAYLSLPRAPTGNSHLPVTGQANHIPQAESQGHLFLQMKLHWNSARQLIYAGTGSRSCGRDHVAQSLPGTAGPSRTHARCCPPSPAGVGLLGVPFVSGLCVLRHDDTTCVRDSPTLCVWRVPGRPPSQTGCWGQERPRSEA